MLFETRNQVFHNCLQAYTENIGKNRLKCYSDLPYTVFFYILIVWMKHFLYVLKKSKKHLMRHSPSLSLPHGAEKLSEHCLTMLQTAIFSRSLNRARRS